MNLQNGGNVSLIINLNRHSEREWSLDLPLIQDKNPVRVNLTGLSGDH